MITGDSTDIGASRRGRRGRTSQRGHAGWLGRGRPLVVTTWGLDIGTTVGGDSVRQGGGILAGDEESPDHQVELDRVENAVAVVGLLGYGGEPLGLLLLVVGVDGTTICDRAAEDAV